MLIPEFQLWLEFGPSLVAEQENQESPDHRWDRFEEEFDVRREWMQTNKGSKHTKKPNDILAEVGGDAKFLIKLKDLKLATRLSKIPPDVHPKKLKLLHNFLDLYVETFE
ncbi:hypothetical protein CH375_15440 [Leptospira ellisii]|nr:hypothetical protein CH375_15440 [Leptospira ellisii]